MERRALLILAVTSLLGAGSARAQQAADPADGFYLVAPEDHEAAVRLVYRGRDDWEFVHPEALMSFAEVTRTEVDTDDLTEQVVVRVWLSPAGRQRFAEITAAHVTGRVAVVVDGVVVTAPRINEPIKGAELQISGAFDAEEAGEIAARLSPRTER